MTSLVTPAGGRLRVWQDLEPEAQKGEVAPSWDTFPIDLLDHIADGATVIDQDDKIVAANHEFHVLYDVPKGRSVIGVTLAQVVRDAWAAAGCAAEGRALFAGSVHAMVGPFEVELPDGQWRRVSARPLANGSGYFSHADITVLKRQQQNLLAAERRAREGEYKYRLLAENASDVIIAMSADLRVQFVSPAVRRVLGWSPEDLVAAPLTHFLHEDARSAFFPARGLTGGHQDRHATFTCQMRTAAGAWAWMEASLGLLPDEAVGEHAIAMVCSFRDVTERVRAERALKLAHDELSSMAATDALTGLANRRRFDSQFDLEWRRAARDRRPLSLMLIDVDHFKAVNDRHGHVIGDECLRRVAELLRASMRRPGDLASRYGGEEFAVLLPETPAAGTLAVVEKIRASMAQEDWSRISPNLPRLTVSIGVCSVQGTEAVTMAEMLRRADEALYRAKNNGRNRFDLHEIP
ncbi:MAG: diguanylate cyclase [Pseudomonadota bacterium]